MRRRVGASRIIVGAVFACLALGSARAAPPAAEARTAGTIPTILLWKPADIISSSPELLLPVFETLGESYAVTSDLFAFGPNLGVHEIVYVFAGIGPNNHLMSNPEGNALAAFVFNGGKLLLEGGDCFNYDPEELDTFNLRPIFGLLDGPDGTRDLFDVSGVNDLAGFQFQYMGPNRFTDDLVPDSSIPVFRNTTTSDVVAVFNPRFGAGRAIGASFELGHLVDVPSLLVPSNTKVDLFVEFLRLLRDSTPPSLVTSTATVADTLFAGDTGAASFTISNPGSLNLDLAFSITESPAAAWLSLAPTAGVLHGNENTAIDMTFDASSLAPGAFSTSLLVTANDSANAADTVLVSMLVTVAPDLVISPDSLGFAVLIGGGTDVDSLTLSNVGGATLEYSLAVDDGGHERVEFPSTMNAFAGGNRYRGNIYRADSTTEIRRIEHLATIAAPLSLEFFVYQSTSSASVYTKIFSTTVLAPGGPGWKGSGPVEVPLLTGNYYFIGVGWQGLVTYFDDAGTTPLPFALSFGECLGSAGSNTFPPPPTKFLNPSPTIASQAIEFGETANLEILSPTSGQIAAATSANVVLRATGGGLPGMFTASLLVESNDPTRGPRTTIRPVPIGVLVGTPTGAPSVVIETPARRAAVLFPATPNPFRAATTIRFDLPHGDRVALRIYDLGGRLVCSLFEGEIGAGSRSVDWDGRDAAGSAVSAGVYFYSLETRTEELRRKTIRLR